jgi:hypothetical protein
VISFEVDTRGWALAIDEYARGVKVSSEKVLRSQAKRFVELVIKLTPPRTLGQGRKAVKRDLGRAVFLLLPEKLWDPIIRRLVEKRMHKGLQAFFDQLPPRAAGIFRRRQVVPGGDIPRVHRINRDRRGRVHKDQRNATPDKAQWNRELRLRQRNVGLAKAGWLPAALALGATIPGWIRRHRPRYGAVDIQQGAKFQIVMTSHCNYIPGYDRVVRFALNSRIRSMAADLKRLMAGGKNRPM